LLLLVFELIETNRFELKIIEMAESFVEEPSYASKKSRNNRAADRIDWGAIVPVSFDSEDAMNPARVAAKWQYMYTLAGLRSPGEETQAAFRLAVYAYACRSGTSREGTYSGEIVMADGTKFTAAVIPRAVGKIDIRKFFRGNSAESYEALKLSRVMQGDERFVAKCEELGIGAEEAFATADWLGDCAQMTPSERVAHSKSLNYGLSRARRARDGRALEQVEEGRVEKGLQVQGNLDQGSSSKIDFY